MASIFEATAGKLIWPDHWRHCPTQSTNKTTGADSEHCLWSKSP